MLTPESPENGLEDLGGDAPVKPYEKRALNFLVNEYLLMQDYKLTSVTFSEENENQVRVNSIMYGNSVQHACSTSLDYIIWGLNNLIIL